MMAAAIERAARDACVLRLQLGVRADQPRLAAFRMALGFERDDTVSLSSPNPLTAPAVTMARRLPPSGNAAGA
jgi:hypothetical protein